MKAEGYWEILTIRAGQVEEKTKHFVSASEARGRRKKDKEKKDAMNDKSAVRRCARVIHANFKAGDILLGLDYSDEGLARVEARADKLMRADPELEREDAILQAAEHEARLCVDRVRRSLGKRERKALKYLIFTSDMDGETGEMVRVHHHLVIPRGYLRIFQKKWKLGRCKGKPLEQQKDYTALAEYLCRQVRRRPDAKKYMVSRNMNQPVVRRRAAIGNAELRVPKGCELLHRGEYEPGWSGGQYIRYFRPGPEKKTGEGDNSWT